MSTLAPTDWGELVIDSKSPLKWTHWQSVSSLWLTLWIKYWIEKINGKIFLGISCLMPVPNVQAVLNVVVFKSCLYIQTQKPHANKRLMTMAGLSFCFAGKQKETDVHLPVELSSCQPARPTCRAGFSLLSAANSFDKKCVSLTSHLPGDACKGVATKAPFVFIELWKKNICI